MPDEYDAAMEFAIAFAAAMLLTMRRARRLEVLQIMERRLGEPDGSGRRDALGVLRAHVARFMLE
jgi:hypothetical protein